MANQFIVNLSTEGGLPLAEAVLAGWDETGATIDADGTTAALDVVSSTGSGSGAKATVTVTGQGTGAEAVTVTITVGGDGYAVGDEVSLTGDGVVFTGDLTLTLDSAALVTPDSEAQALVPVDYALFVQLADSAAGAVDMRQIQPDKNTYWRLSLNGGTTDNAEAILLAVNIAMKQAMQAPHRNPVLVLPEGVTCYDVKLSS